MTWFSLNKVPDEEETVRLKGGMSCGMWHGMRNDIIIQNAIYRKWHKEIN